MIPSITLTPIQPTLDNTKLTPDANFASAIDSGFLNQKRNIVGNMPKMALAAVTDKRIVDTAI